MKNHRFLWLRNRTTDNRKCEKARNIKEKRTIEMFSTVSRQPVALRSSASDNLQVQMFGTIPPKGTSFGGIVLMCPRNKKIDKHLYELYHRMK